MNPLRTPFSEALGIDYPVVQTGMGWVSGANLTAATSAAGGLGILASATMTFSELELAIHRVKERTDKPFGVNLRSDHEDVERRIGLIIEQGVRLASFAQAPSEAAVKRLKDAGVYTMPTIGAVRHAEKVAEWGVDAVIAQGHEGGGHTGPVATTLLLPRVCAAVDIPVLGAGGFFDGRGLVAALAYGAAGIAMGTRFLLTQESTVPDAVKQIYLDTSVKGTVVTTAIDGYPQRVIRTEMIERLENAGGLMAFPRAMKNALRFRKITGATFFGLLKEALAMRKSQGLTMAQLGLAANAPILTKASMVDGQHEVGILPTGQVTGAIEELPSVAELLERIMTEAQVSLRRLGVHHE
jgi:NAD(P)H-dependent flavin oxidoreductase YrpB (nitropropane dioxygenase family)